MKDLLEELARQLVDFPNQVKVKEILSDQTIIYELSVAKADLGKIIGAKGRNISAIRTIINAASGKIQQRVIIDLIE
jgi:predicted RNA-binding protein YlqC (UPF0109 family)